MEHSLSAHKIQLLGSLLIFTQSMLALSPQEYSRLVLGYKQSAPADEKFVAVAITFPDETRLIPDLDKHFARNPQPIIQTIVVNADDKAKPKALTYNWLAHQDDTFFIYKELCSESTTQLVHKALQGPLSSSEKVTPFFRSIALKFGISSLFSGYSKLGNKTAQQWTAKGTYHATLDDTGKSIAVRLDPSLWAKCIQYWRTGSTKPVNLEPRKIEIRSITFGAFAPPKQS